MRALFITCASLLLSACNGASTTFDNKRERFMSTTEFRQEKAQRVIEKSQLRHEKGLP